ncbi:MAG: hypothetical protein LC790_02720 [Actinobacteria bacterium]|nr:hypothetical protein [Actinomycetota bacterium]
MSAGELHGKLDRFRGELHAAGLRKSTVDSYLAGSTLFVRWLAGDYAPGTRRAEAPPGAADQRRPEAADQPTGQHA